MRCWAPFIGLFLGFAYAGTLWLVLDWLTIRGIRRDFAQMDKEGDSYIGNWGY